MLDGRTIHPPATFTTADLVELAANIASALWLNGTPVAGRSLTEEAVRENARRLDR
ncbi:hypothetical protein [Salarchaeum sp. JOR-1]|uniref:hypothetical protein n=1 Tax=Salarchaeum sp. JOR-1 TaxID=2599399 RepID=UPI00143D9210|nr:hypothetical protein [Salarchaeum sp. JOR-1]